MEPIWWNQYSEQTLGILSVWLKWLINVTKIKLVTSWWYKFRTRRPVFLNERKLYGLCNLKQSPPSSRQDGRCCVWMARSWRGWASSRRRWGKRSCSKSSSCRSEKRSATCSSLVEVSKKRVGVGVCACVCERGKNKESDKLRAAGFGLNREAAVGDHAVTHVEVDAKVHLFLIACGFIDGGLLICCPCPWMMARVNTFIIQPSITWLGQ